MGLKENIRSTLIFGGAVFALSKLANLGFSPKVKREAWENAGKRCEMCGAYIAQPQGIHHCVPENALRGMGIKGRDNLANARVLCNDKQRDCHEKADQLAIKKRLFWNGHDFVPLSQVDPECYTQVPQERRID